MLVVGTEPGDLGALSPNEANNNSVVNSGLVRVLTKSAPTSVPPFAVPAVA